MFLMVLLKLASLVESFLAIREPSIISEFCTSVRRLEALRLSVSAFSIWLENVNLNKLVFHLD